MMASQNYDRIKAIVLAALEQPGPARRAYLDEMCAGDAVLRTEVESLLAHDAVAGGGLVPAGAARLITPTLLTQITPAPGVTPSMIGNYSIRGVLGEGGMGTVYHAEQVHPIRREVALKLIRRGLDTDRIIARFDAERQALALMDHPHIAKVLDAGASADGRPYVVMELVQGIPITQYCDTSRLSTDARLAVFLAVCQGVQHAHQKGIIHRDLKPSNVLMREVDGVPVPKIIDFGIAKAIGEARDVSRSMTQAGHIVGTPEYMSPEQAGVVDAGIDTRTDVYSLGVMLYELLTDRRPYEFTSYTGAEIHRVLGEKTPARPSTVLTRVSVSPLSDDQPPGGTPDTISAARQTTIERLRRQLAGDLDNIALKALAREPSERYSSVEQLADDLRRYQDGLPVRARPAIWHYRVRKFVRRHRVGVASTAAIGILLTAATIALAVQAAHIAAERDHALGAEQRAREQELRALTEAATAKQVSEYLTGLFQAFDPWNKDAHLEISVTRRILDKAVVRVRAELADQPGVQASLLHTMGAAYRGIGALAEGQSLLETALALRRRHLGSRHADVAATFHELAMLSFELEDYVLGERHARESLAIRHEVFGRAHPQVADTLSLLGLHLLNLGRLNDAESALREAVGIYERLLGPEHGSLTEPLITLSGVLLNRGKFDAAEALGHRALAISRRAYGDAHPWTLTAVDNLGSVAHLRGDYETAERLNRQVLAAVRKVAPDHSRAALVTWSLAQVLNDKRDFRAAASLFREALEILRKHPSPPRRVQAMVQRDLAVSLAGLGETAEPERLYQRAIDSFRRHWPNGHVDVISALRLYGELLLDRGRLERAQVFLREAYAMAQRLYPSDDRSAAETAISLGRCLTQAKRFEEAERLMLDGDRRLVAWGGAAHPRRQEGVRQIAALYRAWGKPGLAEKYRD